MAQRDTVLVTGAGGCVGSHLVNELLAQGYQVKATDLPGKPFDFGGSRVTAMRGDLTDRKFLDDVALGVEHIIHAGAAMDTEQPWADIRAINLDATVNLWQRAVEVGVERFVFFSSGSLYRSQERPITEDDPLEPQGQFERTKFMAERTLLRSKADGAQTRLCILRPGLIIGPFGTALMSAIATYPPILKRYVGFAPKMRGGPLTNVVHALDVARAAAHLLDHGDDATIYNVANDDALPFSDFFNLSAKAYGLPVLPVPIPFLPREVLKLAQPLLGRPELYWMFNRTAGVLWDRLKAKHELQGNLQPHVDREIATYATEDMVFDTSKIHTLGFETRFHDFRSTIRDVMDWYRTNRWIP